jgi:serine/threonine protein kinase
LKAKEMEDKYQDKLIGRILFKLYRIKKKLGEGSFGKVYSAFNIETKDLYAVKLVSKN